MRRLLRWLGWGALTALLLAAALLHWLLRSESGLRFALTQGIAAAGGTLAYGAVRGSLAGGFELDAPRIELPGARIGASQLALRLRASRLLHGEIHVGALRLVGARLTLLPSTDTGPASATRPGPLNLPVDLVLRNLELLATEIDYGGDEPLRFSVAASEIALRDGALAVAGLALRQGDIALRASAAVDTAQDWQGELASEGEWTLPEVLHRGRLRLAGDLDALAVELAMEGGGELRLAADLRAPLAGAGVDGRLGASAIDLQSFGIDAPVRRLDSDLAFSWVRQQLAVDGPLTLDGRRFDVRLQGLAFPPGQVVIGDLQIVSEEIGRIDLKGHWPTADAAPVGAIEATLTGLWVGDWREPTPADAPRVSASLDLDGRTAAWQATLVGQWQRGARKGPLQLALAGSPERIEVAPSKIGLDGSTLDLAGWLELGADQRLAADLRLGDVDPALFAADWPGKVGGDLRVDATLADSAWVLTVHRLEGELRGAPITLAGRLVGRAAEPREGALRLRWGDGGAELTIPQPQQISLALQDLNLARLGPWEGRVEGRVDTRLDADPMQSTTALLRVLDLAVDGAAAAEVRIGKRPGWNLDLASEDIALAGTRLRPLRLRLAGEARAHTLEIEAREARGRVQAALAGAWQDPRWSGRLESLELKPARGARWALADTAALELDAERQMFGRACLHAAAARACIGATRDPRRCARNWSWRRCRCGSCNPGWTSATGNSTVASTVVAS